LPPSPCAWTYSRATGHDVRITSFYIECFGAIRGLSLDSIPHGLVVFFGENEAGKSSIHAFLKWILMGRPRRRSEDWTYHAPCGDAPYGRVTLSTQRLGVLGLERRKKGRDLVITRQSGERIDSGVDILLPGMTPEVFTQIFAFTLNELGDAGILRDDAITAAIHGVGTQSGAAGRFLSARGEIERRLAEIYAPRGRKAGINACLLRLENIHKELDLASRACERYEGLAREMDEAAEQRDDLEADLRRIERTIARVEALKRLWETWAALKTCEDELASLPEIQGDFPGDALAKLDSFREKRKNLAEMRKTLVLEGEDLEAALRSLSSHTPIIRQEKAIRELAGERELYIRVLADIRNTEREMESVRQKIQGILAELGTGFGEKALSRGLDLFSREKIADFQQKLASIRSEEDMAVTLLAVSEDALREAVDQEKKARKTLRDLEGPLPVTDEETLHLIEDEKARMEAFHARMAALSHDIQRTEGELSAIIASVGLGEDATTFLAPSLSDDFLNAYRSADRDREHAGQKAAEAALYREKKAIELESVTKAIQAKRDELDLLGGVAEGREIEKEKEVILSAKALLAKQEDAEQEVSHLEEKAEAIRLDLLETEALRRHDRTTHLVLASVLTIGGITAWGLFARFLDLTEGLWTGAAFMVALLLLLALSAQRKMAALRIRSDRFLDEEKRIQSLIGEKREAMEQAEQKIKRLVPMMGEDLSAIRSELDRLESGIEKRIARAEISRSVYAEIQRLEREQEGLKKEIESIEAERKRHMASCTKAEGSLKDLLDGAGLSPHPPLPRSDVLIPRLETAMHLAARLRGLQEEERSLREGLDHYRNMVAGITGLGDLSLGDAFFRRIDGFVREERERHERAKRLYAAEEAFQKASDNRKDREEQVAERKADLDRISRRREEIDERWKTWTREKDLPSGIHPSVALDVIRRLDEAAGLLAREEDLKKRLSGFVSFREGYERRVREVSLEIGLSPPPADGIHHRVEKLEDMRTKAISDMARGREMEDRARRIDARLAILAEEEKELAGGIDRLLASGGARDEEDYIVLARIALRRKELSAEIARLESLLRHGSGGRDLSELAMDFASSRPEDLDASLQALEREKTEADSRLRELADRMTGLLAEQKALATSEDLFILRSREDCLREEMREKAREWSVYAIARFLMEETRKRFEKERQPAVLREAERYFSLITEGAYTRVIAPMEGEAIEVETAKGRRKTVGELSRGTLEQLYLSLRLGYIANYRPDLDPVPVFMDDILVNFDPRRAAAAARVLNDFAANRQVFLFTCHPDTVEIIRENASDAAFYSIDNHGIEQIRKISLRLR